MTKGIDISIYQKGLNLQDAKKIHGVGYVVIRAGIGESVDQQLEAHTKGAIDAKLPYGFYWYSRAFSTGDAEKEAKVCLNAIKGYAPAYPVYYDMEQKDQIDKLNNTARTEIITTFCDIIGKAGYTAGIYLNRTWLENYVDKKSLLEKYDLWLACWTNDPDVQPKYQYGQKMWQWGVDRICGMDVDGDICYFDYDQRPKK